MHIFFLLGPNEDSQQDAEMAFTVFGVFNASFAVVVPLKKII